MPYQYPFTHNLRTETEFRSNILNYSNLMFTDYVNYSSTNITERNKFTELLSYMHLKDHNDQPTELCREVMLGNTNIALLNFVEKFQYPNFCSTLGPAAKNSDIKLIPLRTILKLLYIKHVSSPNDIPFLTLDEIRIFIFSNSKVYLNVDFDYLSLWNEITEYRKTGSVPATSTASFTITPRKLKGILNILNYSGMVEYSNKNKQIELEYNNLTQELQESLIKIISNNSFFDIIDTSSATKSSYFAYMDLPKPVSTLSPNMDMSHILQWFTSNPDQVYNSDLVANFHINLNCLPTKHFVIISGVSGTGKTNLIKQYANAVYNTTGDNNPYFKLISVRPDWEDEKALFGYYNALEKKYEIPEFLKTIIQATLNSDKNYFICLDEMNLAHVEYYFSDYLSAVESNEPINLNNFYMSQMSIPPNVFIIGTINEDETTERISDKVWDRAFKVEMNDVHVDHYLTEYCNKYGKNLTIITDLVILSSINTELAKVNMHFGYRFVKEIVEKLDYNYQILNSHFSTETLVDNALMEKIIPKIKIEIVTLDVLKNLKGIIQLNSYPKTNSKLNEMIEALETASVVW